MFRPALPISLALALAASMATAWADSPAAAAPATVVIGSAGGGTLKLEASGPVAMPVGKVEAAKPDEKPKPDDKKPGDEKKPGEDKKGDDKDKSEGPKPVQRPTKPAAAPNPEELKARPDTAGRVRFNFTGQAWPSVLQWYADVAGMSLDWQELPGDYLNLVTQRSYTLDEARDLLNRHLFARGFTMIRQGELLSVVNLKKLDAGIVPRVDPADLDRREPYEFVKLSLPLDWLMADALVEELKPMLSPYGKLTPLAATNRLEAIDAVVNLREIVAVLRDEQSGGSQERLVREFVLKFAKASEVVEQLQTLLGMEGKPAGAAKPGSPEQAMQMQQQMQQQMQAMQQQQQQQGGKPSGPPKPKPETSLVVNRQRNSVLVRAPADRMAIVAQAIKTLDVPLSEGEPLLGNVARMQVYRLANIDPEPLVKTLEEIGRLDPSARLQVDKANRSIIAYAPLADHVTIRALVEKLDGSGRRFEVITLRRLDAEYVAGTIDFMLNGPKEKTQRRNPFEWNPWGSSSKPKEDEKPHPFRVDADVQFNRLLLFANDVELEEVRKLLVKLGEIPPDQQNPSTMRVLDIPAGPETDAWLERLRAMWPNVAPNPLVLPPKNETNQPKPTDQPAKPSDKRTSVPAGRLHLADFPREGEPASGQTPANAPSDTSAKQPPAAAPADKSAPVVISRGPDGRLVLSSSDTKALDRLEELISQSSPPSKTDFHIFRLKYAWASGVASLLKDVFKEDDQERRTNPFWWEPPPDDSDKQLGRLSKRRPLKIISDADTNSILVLNADAGQLKRVEELVQFYDRVEPTDARSVRKTETITLRYTQAKVVAETIKDVYRDLLSEKDKAMQSNQRRTERSFTYIFDMGKGDNEQKAPTFKGLLSVGVDDVSNSLIVSAPLYLFEDVSRLIDKLDQAASPTVDSVRVLQLGSGASSSEFRETLSRVLGTNVGGSKSDRSAKGPKRTDASGNKPGTTGSKSNSSSSGASTGGGYRGPNK